MHHRRGESTRAPAHPLVTWGALHGQASAPRRACQPPGRGAGAAKPLALSGSTLHAWERNCPFLTVTSTRAARYPRRFEEVDRQHLFTSTRHFRRLCACADAYRDLECQRPPRNTQTRAAQVDNAVILCRWWYVVQGPGSSVHLRPAPRFVADTNAQPCTKGGRTQTSSPSRRRTSRGRS